MSRYIDADKLIFNLEKWSTPMVVDRNHDFIEILKGEPTADVKPVVHGKWKRRLVCEPFVCSECGLKLNADIRGWNFCPSCGADMREEDT